LHTYKKVLKKKKIDHTISYLFISPLSHLMCHSTNSPSRATGFPSYLV
jgi:hypothetical protein